LKSADQQEICWHIAQVVPRLKYTNKEERQLLEILKKYLSHKSKIVRVSALESLAIFAKRDNSIMDEVAQIIRMQVEIGSPAIQARGR